MDISFWAATDPGRVREINEDNFLVDKGLGLFVVCDGMGGHAAGEVASSMAARVMRDVLAANREVVERCCESPADPERRRDVSTLLEFAVRDACARIHAVASKESGSKGMGTTLSALLLCGTRGFVGHVGDSRIYLLRHEAVHQLTEDHTLVNELLKRGRLSPEEVAELPIKNAVTRAVGVYETVDVDTQSFAVLAKDRFLLCSDGLHNYFGSDERVVQPLLAGLEPSTIPRRAVDFANARGGRDNITALVVEIGGEEGQRQSQLFRLGLAALAHEPLFAHLEYTERTRILDVGVRRTLRAGESIGERSLSGLQVLLSGSVWLESEGQRRGRIEAPRALGLLSLLGQSEPEIDYRACEPATVLALPDQDVMSLFSDEPVLASKLLWNAAQILGRDLSAEDLELGGGAGALVPLRAASAASAVIDDLTDEVSLLESSDPLESGEFLDPDEVQEVEEPATSTRRTRPDQPLPASLGAVPGTAARAKPRRGDARRGDAVSPRIEVGPRGTPGRGARRDTVETPMYVAGVTEVSVERQAEAEGGPGRFARLRSMLEPDREGGNNPPSQVGSPRRPTRAAWPTGGVAGDAVRGARGSRRGPTAASRHDEFDGADTTVEETRSPVVDERTVRMVSPYHSEEEE